MRRRLFIGLLGGAFTSQALPAHAQETKKPTRIGFLPLGSESSAYDQSLVEEFRRGLYQLGLIENRDFVLDVVWISTGPDDAVIRLLQRGAAILVTCGTSSPLAARRQTWTIPIVFVSVGNPVGIGLAESTSHPGHNATGLSDVLGMLGGKLVGIADEQIKPLRIVYYIWHTEWADGEERLRTTKEAANTAGLTLHSQGVRDISEAGIAIAAMKDAGATVIIVQPSPFTYRERARLIDLAMAHGVGAIFAFPVAAREGALIAYGPDYKDMHAKAAGYVDRLLKGAVPSDLPVDEASKLELVVNLKTAKQLGLEISPLILVGANEMIE